MFDLAVLHHLKPDPCENILLSSPFIACYRAHNRSITYQILTVATKMTSDSELPETPPAAEAEAKQATEKPGKRNACNIHHYALSNLSPDVAF